MLTKIVLISFVALGCVYLVSGAVSQSLPSTHPDHPESCWDFDAKKAYKVGEEFSPGGCQKGTCDSDYSLSYESCGVVIAGEGAKVVSDETKPYPECCPTIVASSVPKSSLQYN